ncbi:TlpA family protein disulfide reductase [Ancylomarina sp. DW003]|nr:TlpA disulfide reductase family protein [Ancylomarina sp. DW003]MDE5423222.1 TlpA family protein disulfide reductase [Ancylomarina sp. DW003]
MQEIIQKFEITRKVKLLFGILLILFSITSISSCSSGGSDDPIAEIPMEEDDDGDNGNMKTSAPDFTLQSVDDNTVNLSDFENKVLVIFFFGDNCPLCKAVGPSIESEINDHFKSNSNFAIIGIDQWDGNKSSVQSFRNVTGISFPLLLKGSSVAKDYETTYDRLVVIDKNGDIVFKGTKTAANDIDAAKQKVQDNL